MVCHSFPILNHLAQVLYKLIQIYLLFCRRCFEGNSYPIKFLLFFDKGLNSLRRDILILIYWRQRSQFLQIFKESQDFESRPNPNLDFFISSWYVFWSHLDFPIKLVKIISNLSPSKFKIFSDYQFNTTNLAPNSTSSLRSSARYQPDPHSSEHSE